MAKTTRATAYMTEGDFQRIATDRIRARHRRNPALQLLSSAKNRARKYALAFNLVISDITVPTICPVLGIPLDFSTKDNVPTLDRVVPSHGYVRDNVCVISWRANRLKLNATLSELRKLVTYVERELDKHSGLV
jgi:hypothetical protein